MQNKMEYVRAHGKPLLAFKDILKERHVESDMLWVSREFHWTKAYKRSKETKSLFYLQEEVMKSPRILKLVEEVSWFFILTRYSFKWKREKQHLD